MYCKVCNNLNLKKNFVNLTSCVGYRALFFLFTPKLWAAFVFNGNGKKAMNRKYFHVLNTFRIDFLISQIALSPTP